MTLNPTAEPADPFDLDIKVDTHAAPEMARTAVTEFCSHVHICPTTTVITTGR
jgi:hypothetical protein